MAQLRKSTLFTYIYFIEFIVYIIDTQNIIIKMRCNKKFIQILYKS